VTSCRIPGPVMSKPSADADEATGEAQAGKGGGKKKMLPLIAGGVLLLLAAGGGGAYMAGLLDGLLGGDEAAHDAAGAGGGGHDAAAAGHDGKPAADAAPTFYALPEILVSLNTGDRRSTFLKLKVSLELASAQDPARIEQMLPRLVDYCQVYLRELRLEEVRGSAGMARLREELLRRISSAVAPIPVKDVLFSDVFIQ